MRVNIIITANGEQFEVLLCDEEAPLVRNANGQLVTEPKGVLKLWERAAWDALQWITSRIGEPDAASEGDHRPQA